MEKDNINREKAWAMYKEIRDFETRNVKSQKLSDKQVVDRLVKYIENIAKKEVAREK